MALPSPAPTATESAPTARTTERTRPSTPTTPATTGRGGADASAAALLGLRLSLRVSFAGDVGRRRAASPVRSAGWPRAPPQVRPASRPDPRLLSALQVLRRRLIDLVGGLGVVGVLLDGGRGSGHRGRSLEGFRGASAVRGLLPSAACSASFGGLGFFRSFRLFGSPGCGGSPRPRPSPSAGLAPWRTWHSRWPAADLAALRLGLLFLGFASASILAALASRLASALAAFASCCASDLCLFAASLERDFSSAAAALSAFAALRSSEPVRDAALASARRRASSSLALAFAAAAEARAASRSWRPVTRAATWERRGIVRIRWSRMARPARRRHRPGSARSRRRRRPARRRAPRRPAVPRPPGRRARRARHGRWRPPPRTRGRSGSVRRRASRDRGRLRAAFRASWQSPRPPHRPWPGGRPPRPARDPHGRRPWPAPSPWRASSLARSRSRCCARLGVLALAACGLLGLLAIAARGGLGFLAVLPAGLGRLLDLGHDVGRRGGPTGGARPDPVVERGAIMAAWTRPVRTLVLVYRRRPLRPSGCHFRRTTRLLVAAARAPYSSLTSWGLSSLASASGFSRRRTRSTLGAERA